MRAAIAVRHEVQMSTEQESELWRQRYFEAQAGMERFLSERYGNQEISRWLRVRSEILDGLNDGQPSLQDVASWKSRFFRTQALLEKYLVEYHSLEDIEGWTRAIGEVFRHTEPDRGGGAADLAVRLAKQAQCYGSDYEIESMSPEFARLRLNHCAIWDYREEARKLGVQLTLKSPCTFCTKATIANVQAKGFEADFELHENGPEHGCSWNIGVPRNRES